MIRRLARRVTRWYRQSWMGHPTEVTNGRITAVSVALLGLCVAVPYMLRAEDVAEERRDCLTRAAAGAEIKDTAMEGVKHAEETANLMDTLVDILEASRRNDGAPSASLIAIRREVDEYAAGVDEFRKVAEQYTPVSVAQCG